MLDENAFYFTIQVGSFENSDNAQKLKENLEKLGFKPELSQVQKKGKNFYRIRTGRFDKKEEVLNYLSELQAKGYSGIICP